MAIDIYFTLTENCNLRCRHCFASAGPGKEDTTIPSGHFRAIVDNFPEKFIYLTLTGGEVFTIEDKLYGFLEHIKEANERRKAKAHFIVPVV